MVYYVVLVILNTLAVVGIELNIFSSKIMTVISLPWNLHLTFTAGNRRPQVTSVVRRRLLVRQVLHLHL